MSLNPPRFVKASLAGAQFRDVNLGSANFDDVNLANASFFDVSLAGARFHCIDFSGVEITGANLSGMKIDGILVTDVLSAHDAQQCARDDPASRLGPIQTFGVPDSPKPSDSASRHPIATWHELVKANDPSGLDDLLADDVVFISPVVHKPQCGKVIAKAYLSAAFRVFFNPSFRYVREILGNSDAMLEFETEIDGVLVNGVDIVKWDEAGRIVEFKVMARPLKAITVIHERMGAMLAAAQSGA